MGDTVFVNGRAAVHKGSSGKSIAFPDVCLCPPTPPAGPVPMPLPNNVQAADLQGGATSVTIEGNPMGKKSSFIMKSTGDEASQTTGGGVVTHIFQGKAYFGLYSMNVLVEGEEAVRHLDLITHNHMGPKPGNTPPMPWLSTMSIDVPTPPRSASKDKRKGKETIEISLVDQDGLAMGGARYEVTLPDGEVVRGRLPASGEVKIGGIPKGKCQIELPDLKQAKLK